MKTQSSPFSVVFGVAEYMGKTQHDLRLRAERLSMDWD